MRNRSRELTLLGDTAPEEHAVDMPIRKLISFFITPFIGSNSNGIAVKRIFRTIDTIHLNSRRFSEQW
jgi:hypothetical protein